MRILTLLFLLISFSAAAQNFDVLPTADTVLSTDKMLIRPLSTTNPALRRITLEQLKRFVNRGITAADTTKWSLTGNAGTTPGTNFIGTTDNKDLIFKVAGVFSGQIDTGTGNTSLGMRALYSLTSGSANTAFGASALQNVTSGRENVAFGATALQRITTTRRNTAVGLSALAMLTSGDRNTAVGFNSFINLTSGGSNVAIGNKSGGIITNADRCVFVGDSARGATTGLVNAIAIGYNAYVGASNSMVLGNDVNVGIGTATPGYKLDVNGSWQTILNTNAGIYGRLDASGFSVNATGETNFRSAAIIVDTTGLISLDANDSVTVNTTKLQLKVNATQGSGKVLTSDADGNATWGNQILTDTATFDFGAIAPNGHETLTITVTGAALDDVVSLGIPNSSVSDHGAYMAWVSATNTVSVKCFNFDGIGFDPAEGVFKVKVFK